VPPVIYDMLNLSKLPLNAGLGLKPEHYDDALACSKDGLWFEIHPENYMVAGGPRLAWLQAFCDKFPMSFHGVGLSLGGIDRPDKEHLKRLKYLIDRFSPAQVSEHFAWSKHDNIYFADLLPPPINEESLNRIVAHIEETQEYLGRTILIENPSLYLPVTGFEELPHIYVEAAKRSGAGLLFDLNNIAVCAANVDLPYQNWLDVVPGDMVGEVHLAGSSSRTIKQEVVLIDSHDAPVSELVWQIFEKFIHKNGVKPVLIERDDNIPTFDELLAERDHAEDLMREFSQEAADV